ncbi:hypothetical protein ONE63_000435 [Megalurothrips usitatus]|uniref:Uncharacterized protein n=1 Tax=Megalurothrips usitatus TaxID=439358 RepID=A0AAV7Y284_9NEOP|nr:hypothetical protein ONE63_000435 [Megalurothrips usitatus]
MRRTLQHGFQAMEAMAEAEAEEANARCSARCRTISRRFAWFYVPLCLSASLLIVCKAFSPPDERGVLVNFPRFLLESDLTYWPIFVASLGAFVNFFFYSVGYDTLFLSLCLHLSTKCDILKVMLRSAGQHRQVCSSSDSGGGQAGPRGSRAERCGLPSGPQAPGGPARRQRYHFEYWNDDGSALDAGAPSGATGCRRQAADRLRTCALYHQEVIK